LEFKSNGIVFSRCTDEPKRAFIQLLKKTVGARRYRRTINSKHRAGYRSKKKLKNRISATNMIEPGKPKKINKFTRLIKKSLGHKKFTPFISVIRRVLNRRPIASTSKKELVDNKA